MGSYVSQETLINVLRDLWVFWDLDFPGTSSQSFSNARGAIRILKYGA